MGIAAVLIRTAGRPALRYTLPQWLGIVMVASVIFGGNGMDTATAVAGMRASPGARLALWLGWLLLAAPGARALFAAPSLDYLRWLPIAQSRLWLVLGALLLVLQTPWVMLFAWGGGALPALAALWLSAGALAVVVIRPRPGERLARLAALIALVGLWAAPLPLGPNKVAVVHILAGLGAWLGALPLAWRRASERNREQRSQRLLPGLLPALAQCHLASVYRTSSSTLWRGFLAMLIGAGATYMMVRANGLGGDEVAIYSAVVTVVCAAFACAGLSTAVAESEVHLDWLLASTGVSPGARAGARVIAGASLGALLGAIYGGLTVSFVPMAPLAGGRVIAGAAGIVVAQMWLALCINSWSRSARSHRTRRTGDGPKGSWVVGGLALAAVAQFVALGMFGDLAVLGFVSLAFALCWGRT